MTTLDLTLPVRIHTELARYPWAKLWYFCRALDQEGRGIVVVKWSLLRAKLGRNSTIYEWLRTGKQHKAFLYYRRTKDTLVLHLGAKDKVCRNLQLNSWGFTAVISLGEVIKNLRPWATATVTKSLQDNSHKLAVQSLNKRERKHFTVPTAEELLQGNNLPSPKTPVRGKKIPFLMYKTAKSLFVTRSFLVHGVRQERIAEELNLCDRTIRRHLDKTVKCKKQIHQSRGAYQELYLGLVNDAPEIHASLKDAHYLEHPKSRDSRLLWENHPITGKTNRKPSEISLGRFFFWKGQCWLRRTNLYLVDCKTVTERTQKREYRRSIGELEHPEQDPLFKQVFALERSKGADTSDAQRTAYEALRMSNCNNLVTMRPPG